MKKNRLKRKRTGKERTTVEENKGTAPEEQVNDTEETPAENAEAATEEQSAAEKELAEAVRKRDEFLDMAQRIQAEFDNFRKRNASARAEAFEDGTREMIKLILPVVDNLERALEASSEDEKLKEGVSMTLKQLLGVLEKRGVTVISRQGEKFDPRLENAVMQADRSAGEPGTVSQVLQKGYRMGDYVLRHAMVQVVEE